MPLCLRIHSAQVAVTGAQGLLAKRFGSRQQRVPLGPAMGEVVGSRLAAPGAIPGPIALSKSSILAVRPGLGTVFGLGRGGRLVVYTGTTGRAVFSV